MSEITPGSKACIFSSRYEATTRGSYFSQLNSLVMSGKLTLPEVYGILKYWFVAKTLQLVDPNQKTICAFNAYHAATYPKTDGHREKTCSEGAEVTANACNVVRKATAPIRVR